jgi:hypothetical protein
MYSLAMRTERCQCRNRKIVVPDTIYFVSGHYLPKIMGTILYTLRPVSDRSRVSADTASMGDTKGFWSLGLGAITP